MKILFLHGWHSVVGGVKPTYLSDQGHEVLNPALDDDDFEAALRTAQAQFDAHRPDVVVGSSRGGAVAMNLASGEVPLVLLCPAWKRWGSVRKMKPRWLILHSRQDEVIPFAESQELVAASGLPAESLLEVGHDHRLADESSLAVMIWACEVLVAREPLPWQTDLSEPVNSDQANGVTHDEASYICDACGEEIVIPVDLSQGSHQQFVEDCPVCCRANIIHLDIDDSGEARAWATPEQDAD